MIISSTVILKCISGDRKAHKFLYENTIRYVFSVVNRYIELKENQKDIVQEIYVKLFLNIHTFDVQKGSFKFWLRKITINECLGFIRKQKNVLNTIELNEYLPSFQYTTEHTFTEKTTLDKVLHKMPVGYRVIFMMSVVDEYSHKEIGQHLNIKPETSRSQLTRAKKWLKQNFTTFNKSMVYG